MQHRLATHHAARQQARQQASGSLVPDNSIGLITSVAAGFAAVCMSTRCPGLDVGAIGISTSCPRLDAGAVGMSTRCPGLDAGAHPATM